MDLMILNDKTRFIFIIAAISLYLIGIMLGFKRGKKSIRPRAVGTIFVNSNADIKKHEPAFKMRITPEFVDAVYSKSLSNIKYVIFEVREDNNEDNGLF